MHTTKSAEKITPFGGLNFCLNRYHQSGLAGVTDPASEGDTDVVKLKIGSGSVEHDIITKIQSKPSSRDIILMTNKFISNRCL